MTMSVTLIACTQIVAFPSSMDDTAFGARLNDHRSDDTDLDVLAEFAGRSCYQSWTLPNASTAKNAGYLSHIIDVGHFSVLEHGSITVYIEGVSRSLTHELVRHRHLSFSQLSQRFVDESGDTRRQFVIPPAIRDDEDSMAILRQSWDQDQSAYAALVDNLSARGFPRKQAREAARSVLPNATETKIVVTGNIRAWREVIQKRNTPAADAEIRELADLILGLLRTLAPYSVQDL